MNDPRSFRAWLVDVDGTLYHALPVKLAMAAELLLAGRDVVAPLRAFRHQHERLRRSQDESVASPYALQLERTAAEVGLEPAALAEVVDEWMVRRPGRWLHLFRRRGLLTEIDAFRRAGGRTAAVSDYPARSKLAALGASGLFDVVVANGEEGSPGRLKPWPDGYLRAAGLLGVPPGECLVLGDRADADGEAARRGGMAFRRIG